MNIDEEAFRILVLDYAFGNIPWQDLMKWLEKELEK